MVALLLLLLAQAPAPAPTPTPDSESEKPLLEERVVVSATLVETPADEIGSAVTVVPSEEIERKQVRSLADALTGVPGVDVRRSGGVGTNTAIFLRGADSDHTLVLVDGIEVNDPSTPSRSAFIDHLTLDGVERIEVLRGPQSTLYGSDAIGGVVNVVSAKGSGAPTTDFWVEGGSFETLREGLRSSGGGERFDYSVSASHVGSDGFSAAAGGVEDDPYRNTSLAGRFGYEHGGPFGADLFVRHVDANVDFDGSVEEGQEVDARQTLVKLEPRLSLLGGKWEQRLGLRSSTSRRDTQGSFPSLVEGRTTAAEWRNDLLLVPDHTLSFGAEGQWEDGEFGGFEDSARTLGLYVQDQWRLGERTFGTLGFRADDHSGFGSQTTYRITFGHHFPEARTTVRASWGTGFKAPSLTERNQSAFGGNPDLEPEESRGADLGLDWRSRQGRVATGVTVFENRIDQLIVAVFDNSTLTFLNFNVDEAQTSGVEAWAAFDPLERLGLRGSYTYTGTEAQGQPAGFGLTEGSSLLRRPRHKGSLDLRYALDRPDMNLTLGALYVGDRNDLDPISFTTVQADAYWRIDLRADWEINGTASLFARMDNLLDEEYEDVLGFGTAGRSGYVGGKMRF